MGFSITGIAMCVEQKLHNARVRGDEFANTDYNFELTGLTYTSCFNGSIGRPLDSALNRGRRAYWREVFFRYLIGN